MYLYVFYIKSLNVICYSIKRGHYGEYKMEIYVPTKIEGKDVPFSNLTLSEVGF